jgi:Protein of unknown function (DUF3237)
MKNIFVVFFLFSLNTFAQTNPEAPGLEFVCELKVKLKPAIIVGEVALGTRRIIPIVGGSFEGPRMKGEILDGGADWQIVRKDGVSELEAHYQIKTDDGVVIYIKNVGLRVATPEIAAKIAKGEVVTPNDYYFRAVPKFEAPIGSKYEWMNNAIFICRGIRNPDGVVILVWKVL